MWTWTLMTVLSLGAHRSSSVCVSFQPPWKPPGPWSRLGGPPSGTWQMGRCPSARRWRRSCCSLATLRCPDACGRCSSLWNPEEDEQRCLLYIYRYVREGKIHTNFWKRNKITPNHNRLPWGLASLSCLITDWRTHWPWRHTWLCQHSVGWWRRVPWRQETRCSCFLHAAAWTYPTKSGWSLEGNYRKKKGIKMTGRTVLFYVWWTELLIQNIAFMWYTWSFCLRSGPETEILVKVRRRTNTRGAWN